ncbi:MAG: dienelactone hydrolase family protein [Steroidobacteraceae bacterium]
MTNDATNDRDRDTKTADDPSRRDFVALSAAVGLIAATRVISAGERKVIESDVEIKTPDGTCDAVFLHPATGTHPGVLIWTDSAGLRPVYREFFGRPLAAEGYAVLIPNSYYRTGKAPFFDLSKFDFSDPVQRERLHKLSATLAAPGAVESDARAYIAFLDAQRQVNKAKKIGTHGYCMGGPLMMKTAATVPNRVGVGASFHGNALVTDKPDSPHLLASKIEARMTYFGIAAGDDERQPDVKVRLREAFVAAKVPAELEVYPNTIHGWCVPDFPPENGRRPYDKPEAERAWNKLLALYKSYLS